MSSLYKAAASALRQVAEGKRSVKGAAFEAAASFGAPVNKLLPLVDRSSGQRKAITDAVRDCEALVDGGFDEYDVIVGVYEQIFGRGIQGGGRLKRAIVDSEPQLRSALQASVDKHAAAQLAAKQAKGTTTGAAVGQERCIRVNTLLMTVEDAVTALTTGAPAPAAASAAPAAWPVLSPGEVAVDSDVPYLLHLLAPDAHSRLRLHEHPLVANGRLILQDKASALTAHALMQDLLPAHLSGLSSPAASPGADGSVGKKRGRASDGERSGADAHAATAPGLAPKRARLAEGAGAAPDALPAGDAAAPVHALDACAAPGNKTSQLAALLLAAVRGGSSGTAAPPVSVHAFDKDPARAALLHRRMREACGCGASAAARPAYAVSFAECRPEGAADGEGEGEHDSAWAGEDGEEERGSGRQGQQGKGKGKGKGARGKRPAAGAAAPPSPLIRCACADFLALDPRDPAFARVRYLLLDPSCSGSGMAAKDATRAVAGAGGPARAAAAAKAAAAADAAPAMPAAELIQFYSAPTGDAARAGAGDELGSGGRRQPGGQHRVASLAAFQRRALAHALSFPALQRVAYSTCSLWLQEDEAVVAEALLQANAAAVAHCCPGAGEAASGAGDASSRRHQVQLWQLKAGVLPAWQRRGIATVPEPPACGPAPAPAACPGVLCAFAEAGAPHPLPGLTPSQAACCVRVDPRPDAPPPSPGPPTVAAGSVVAGSGCEGGMCGFFVAVLERVQATVSEAEAAQMAREAAAAAAAAAAGTEAAAASKQRAGGRGARRDGERGGGGSGGQSALPPPPPAAAAVAAARVTGAPRDVGASGKPTAPAAGAGAAQAGGSAPAASGARAGAKAKKPGGRALRTGALPLGRR
jgi:16S rRNA C967 or C1407 C5-methylase (RsmB/RsmF family)